MVTRRQLIWGGAAAALAASSGAFAKQAGVSRPELGEDGLYHFDWYQDSFLELADDVRTAKESGRTLALIWSQKGCIYCKQMSQEYFTDPKIAAYVRKHFYVVHMNLFGSREVTDFDGSKASEKNYARNQAIRLTPTIQFFANDPGKSAGKKYEIARMPGLLKKDDFLAMFRFVNKKGYEKSSFSQWRKEGTMAR